MSNKNLIWLIIVVLSVLINASVSEDGILIYKKGEGYKKSDHSSEGERGDSGYDSLQQVANGERGRHDKERHRKEYAESGGHKTAHDHDDGYYDSNHKSAKGRKGFHYADRGSYAKGHDTKGRRNVHKLNEFKKRTDFFDEDVDKAHKENHGGFEVQKVYGSGAAEREGRWKKGHAEGEFGKSGDFERGREFLMKGGFEKEGGKDGYFENVAKFARRNGGGEFNKYYKDSSLR